MCVHFSLKFRMGVILQGDSELDGKFVRKRIFVGYDTIESTPQLT